MTATLDRAGIQEPGTYDLTHADYHADPALSSSGARKLLPPSCPALFREQQTNPTAPTVAMEEGTAAHQMLLGIGPELVTVPGDDFRVKKTRDAAAAARIAGKIPLLAEKHERIRAMHRALLADRRVRALIDQRNGTPEQSFFWRDSPTGIMRRARLDWTPNPDSRRRPIIVDYKTSKSADPARFDRIAVDYGYHCQGPWYLDGAIACEAVAPDAAFVFIVQEKTPPYLIEVIELDAMFMRIGAALNRRAIDTYVQCLADDHWPGYADDISLVSPPIWYERQQQEELQL